MEDNRTDQERPLLPGNCDLKSSLYAGIVTMDLSAGSLGKLLASGTSPPSVPQLRSFRSQVYPLFRNI